jgi:hypothetical protein
MWKMFNLPKKDQNYINPSFVFIAQIVFIYYFFKHILFWYWKHLQLGVTVKWILLDYVDDGHAIRVKFEGDP